MSSLFWYSVASLDGKNQKSRHKKAKKYETETSREGDFPLENFPIAWHIFILQLPSLDAATATEVTLETAAIVHFYYELL